MSFLKVCFFIAVVIGCGLYIESIRTPISPSRARTLPAPPRQHYIRPIPQPVSNNGGIFSDRSVLDNAGGVLGYGFLFCVSGYLLWHGVTQFKDHGKLTAFIPIVVLAVIVGGLWSWFGYFGDHGMFLIWPIVISLVVIALVLVWALVEDRENRIRINAAREDAIKFNTEPVHGRAREATPDDERQANL